MDKGIYEAMTAIMRDMEAVCKAKKNQQQGYSFRGIDDLYNAIHPILAKHGVFCTVELVNSLREERSTKTGGALLYSIIDYKVCFNASDGSSVYSVVRGEAMDSADKASNKALSAAMKYACMTAFLIPTEDIEDSDKGDASPSMKTQIQKQSSPPKPLPNTQEYPTPENPKVAELRKITGIAHDYALIKTLDSLGALDMPIFDMTSLTEEELDKLIAKLKEKPEPPKEPPKGAMQVGDSQISALVKLTKCGNESELRVMAEARFERELNSIHDMAYDEAAKWITELSKKGRK